MMVGGVSSQRETSMDSSGLVVSVARKIDLYRLDNVSMVSQIV